MVVFFVFFWVFVFVVLVVFATFVFLVFAMSRKLPARKVLPRPQPSALVKAPFCFLSKLSYPSSFLLFIDHSFTHLSLNILVLYHPFLSFLIPDHSHYPFPSSPYAFLILFCALSSFLINFNLDHPFLSLIILSCPLSSFIIPSHPVLILPLTFLTLSDLYHPFLPFMILSPLLILSVSFTILFQPFSSFLILSLSSIILSYPFLVLYHPFLSFIILFFYSPFLVPLIPYQKNSVLTLPWPPAYPWSSFLTLSSPSSSCNALSLSFLFFQPCYPSLSFLIVDHLFLSLFILRHPFFPFIILVCPLSSFLILYHLSLSSLLTLFNSCLILSFVLPFSLLNPFLFFWCFSSLYHTFLPFIILSSLLTLYHPFVSFIFLFYPVCILHHSFLSFVVLSSFLILSYPFLILYHPFLSFPYPFSPFLILHHPVILFSFPCPPYPLSLNFPFLDPFLPLVILSYLSFPSSSCNTLSLSSLILDQIVYPFLVLSCP